MAPLFGLDRFALVWFEVPVGSLEETSEDISVYLKLVSRRPILKPKEGRTVLPMNLMQAICRTALCAVLLPLSTAWASLPTNRVDFWNQSVAHPEMDLVRSARSSLDIEIYQMTDPDFRSALRAAVNRGVIIRVVEEPAPLGAKCVPFFPAAISESSDCADLRVLISEVRQAGGVFVPFNKASLCGQAGAQCYEHGKMIIADRSRGLVSTGNFDSTNFCNLARSPSRCNRDFAVTTVDPEVVQPLLKVFESDLAGHAYDIRSIVTAQVESKVTVSPLSLDPLVQFIKSARHSIQVENQYLKEPTINAALMDAARAGLNVQVMTASVCAFGTPKPSVLAQWNQSYASFSSSGVKTRIFNAQMRVDGVPGYLHAKAIVVDGVRAWVGSVNGSSTATSDNREFGLFLDDSSSVQNLASVLTQDFLDPASETWQESASCTKDRHASGSASPSLAGG